MDTLLRKLAEWKGRSKAAQVIVFDGGAEVERTRSFLKGAVTGISLSLITFLFTAPSNANSELVEALDVRSELLEQNSVRLEQAIRVADVCMDTAERLEQTLASYKGFLGTPR